MKCQGCGSTERSYFVFAQIEVPKKYIHPYGQLTKEMAKRKGVRFIDTKWNSYAEVCSQCKRLIHIYPEKVGE